jgi:hypothetical protein
MGGVLTHTLIGLISWILVYFYYTIFHKKKNSNYEIQLYGIAIFVGNMCVDFFKFGFTGLIQGTWKIFKIKQDETFVFWADLTNSFSNWFNLGFLFILILGYLFKHHIIKKKTMFEYDEIVIYFLIGVLTHLLIDLVILETSPWI